MKDMTFLYLDSFHDDYDEIAINTTDEDCISQAIKTEEIEKYYDGNFYIRIPFNPETNRRKPKNITMHYITIDLRLVDIVTNITTENRKEIMQYIKEHDERWMF